MSGNERPVKYHRILLKVSGEMLSGGQPGGISTDALAELAKRIKYLHDLGVQIAIVVGGGNLCRGREFVKAGFEQVAADHIGMVGTIMNAIALQSTIKKFDIPVYVRSALAIDGVVPPFSSAEAASMLQENKIVICAGGTGNPLVTTDTTAALRAIELKADILLKATKVDGVYNADPKQDSNAKLYSQLSYAQVIKEELCVMDLSAFSMCRDHNMPIRVFNLETPGVLEGIVLGEEHGTLVNTGE